jgi:hypothetical protein
MNGLRYKADILYILSIYIYAMEHNSAIKKNEIMLFEGKWMQLEDIRLSEVRQVQKNKRPHIFVHM